MEFTLYYSTNVISLCFMKAHFHSSIILMEVLFIKNMYNIHFTIKFLGFACMCIIKKHVLPSQVPTLGFRFKLKAHVVTFLNITCGIIKSGHVAYYLNFGHKYIYMQIDTQASRQEGKWEGELQSSHINVFCLFFVLPLRLI